jgi:hypothetical protein
LFVGWLQPKSELLYVTSFLLCRSAHHHPLSQQLLLPDVNCRDIVRCDDDDDDDLRPGGGGVSGCEKRPPQQQDQQLQASSTKSKTIRRHTQRERKNCNKRKRNKGPSRLTRVGPVKKTKSTNDSSQNNNSKVITTGINQAKQSKQAHNPSKLFLLFFQGNT